MKYSYEKVKDHLIGIIEDSDDGALLPSEHQLCGDLNVSRVTVRTALSQLEEERLIIRKKGKGSFVLPKSSFGGGRNVVVMSPWINNDGGLASDQLRGRFHGKIISGIFEQAACSLIRLHMLPLSGPLAMLLREIEQCRADGVMLVVPNKHSVEIVNGLRKYHLPVMLVNRTDRKGDFSYVSADYAGGAEKAVRQLIDAGHERIAFVGLDKDQPHILERYEGYTAAFAKAGVECRVSDPFLMDVEVNKPTGVKKLSDAMATYLKQERPTALLTSTSSILENLLLPVIRKNGCSVPDDYELATFDELPETLPEKQFIHEILQPSLDEMGQMAMWTMGRILAGSVKKSECLIPLTIDIKERGM